MVDIVAVSNKHTRQNGQSACLGRNMHALIWSFGMLAGMHECVALFIVYLVLEAAWYP